jgi:hypothetical protein
MTDAGAPKHSAVPSAFGMLETGGGARWGYLMMEGINAPKTMLLMSELDHAERLIWATEQVVDLFEAELEDLGGVSG